MWRWRKTSLAMRKLRKDVSSFDVAPNMADYHVGPIGPSIGAASEVELVLALQVDKAHRRSRRRFREPLRVAIVVLLRLDIRPDMFRRHEPHVVAAGVEDAAEMIGAAAASIPTTRRGSFSASPINVSRLMRRMTTLPNASRPTTLQ